MDSEPQNNLPDWGEIVGTPDMNPDPAVTQPLTDGGRKNGTGRHRKQKPTHRRNTPARKAIPSSPRPSTGERALQCSIGVIFTIVILLLAQIGWMFVGHDLDSIYAQEASAKRVSLGQQVNLDTTRIAQPQSGDVPVDGMPSHTQIIGWMYIPKIESGWKRAIQQGTDQVVLDNQGIGHYEQTVMPGDVGNSAYAGHRTGGDLGYIDRLETGDAIVIQTSEHWYVYKMTESWVTDPSNVSVLNNSESNPDARELTLTTCHPLSVWANESSKHRYIVRAEFSYWANVKDGIPAELSTADKNTAQKLGYKLQKTIRTVSTYAPASPIFAAVLFALWLILNVLSFMLWRGGREPKPSTWNVITLSWRLQQGGLFLRTINMTLFWMTIILLFWWLISPRFNSWLPFMQSVNGTL